MVGIMAMMDPPRASVPDAIAKCQAAGIKVQWGYEYRTPQNLSEYQTILFGTPMITQVRGGKNHLNT